MAIENIFRFISLRPTKLEKSKGRLNMHVYKKDGTTPFYDEIRKAVATGATRENLSEIAKKFKGTQNYILNFTSLKFPVARLLGWISDNGRSTFKDGNFISSVEQITGKPLGKILSDDNFNTTYNDLRDSVLANILSNTEVRDKEEKITAIKILYTLKSVGEKTLELFEDELIDNFFGRSTVIFPFLKTSPREPEPIKLPPQTGETDEREKERNRKKERLNNLETAHKELSRMAVDEKYRFVPEENPSESARIKDLENQVNLLSAKCRDREEMKKLSLASSVNAPVHFAKQEFILSKKAVELLNNPTKQILNDFHFETEKINPVKAVNRIEEEIRYLHENSESDFPYNKMIALGGIYVEKEKLRQAVLGTSNMGIGNTIISFINNCIYKSGIGDLLIVRQKLKAYELAEFAHVENALAGETREREHRRLNLREEITISETESETEKERNLQSTERNEIQNEAEKIIQQQAHVDAGLQVSGSYGPSVSFSASLNAGFSSSVEETQKKSTSYSREVTEKSSEKVKNRVREERRRRVLEQVEEINKHSIANAAPGSKHLRGIYRWLNKIYDAQIFNYGQRMMYEFVIPEPASFFLYATVENPPADAELLKPEAPEFFGAPLKPSNLTRTNYHNYISLYNVTSAPEPPSHFTVKTYFDKQDGKDSVNLGKASAVAIPEGYEAYAAVVSSDYAFPDDGQAHSFHVMIGAKTLDRTPFWGASYENFPLIYRGEISVSAKLLHIVAFTLGADVFCRLTEEAFAKWQIKMYDAIIQAYLDQKAAYDAKIAQKEIQKGVEILGRNPLENRRIEKEELKKLIIMILTNAPYLNFNSFYPFPEPIMDLSKVCQNGAYIRFFENAFEWQNIIYVFYPYFWGRHAKWINAIHLTDPDLDFAAFLKAGAARVQIPVRPGFEKAVAFYCQTGIIWDGNDVPVMGDDLYVPIIKEITENLGKLDDGVPYPADSQPWEVTVPTSLVVLQDLEEIPNIRDMMTGNNIDLQNQNP